MIAHVRTSDPTGFIRLLIRGRVQSDMQRRPIGPSPVNINRCERPIAAVRAQLKMLRTYPAAAIRGESEYPGGPIHSMRTKQPLVAMPRRGEIGPKVTDAAACRFRHLGGMELNRTVDDAVPTIMEQVGEQARSCRLLATNLRSAGVRSRLVGPGRASWPRNVAARSRS